MPTVFQNCWKETFIYILRRTIVFWLFCKYHPHKSWHLKIFSFRWCLCVYLHHAEDLCSFWERRVIKLGFFQDHAFNIGLKNRTEEKLVSFSYRVHNLHCVANLVSPIKTGGVGLYGGSDLRAVLFSSLPLSPLMSLKRIIFSPSPTPCLAPWGPNKCSGQPSLRRWWRGGTQASGMGQGCGHGGAQANEELKHQVFWVKIPHHFWKTKMSLNNPPPPKKPQTLFVQDLSNTW